MGKRDTRVAFVNPIAAARASGPRDSTGPTIQEFLDRPGRPTWEEYQDQLKKAQEKSSTLAQWEEKLNEQFRDDLKKNRDSLLNPSKAKKSSKVKKKKKLKKRSRSPSSSSTSHTSSSDSDSEEEKVKKRKKKSKRKRRHASSSEESEEEERRSKKRKSKKHHKRKKTKKSEKD